MWRAAGISQASESHFRDEFAGDSLLQRRVRELSVPASALLLEQLVYHPRRRPTVALALDQRVEDLVLSEPDAHREWARLGCVVGKT